MSDGQVSLVPQRHYLPFRDFALLTTFLRLKCVYAITYSNLMERDNMANLGLGDVGQDAVLTPSMVPPTENTPISPISSEAPGIKGGKL